MGVRNGDKLEEVKYMRVRKRSECGPAPPDQTYTMLYFEGLQ